MGSAAYTPSDLFPALPGNYPDREFAYPVLPKKFPVNLDREFDI
jgi:hypothetical protein